MAQRRHDDPAVLICDIVGFKAYCAMREPHAVIPELLKRVETYEETATDDGPQRSMTIGDSFMSAAGPLQPIEAPSVTCVCAGLAMIAATRVLAIGWNVRVGVHLGPVVAGVLG